MGLFARKISSYFQPSHASLSPALTLSLLSRVNASLCPRVFLLPLIPLLDGYFTSFGKARAWLTNNPHSACLRTLLALFYQALYTSANF